MKYFIRSVKYFFYFAFLFFVLTWAIYFFMRSEYATSYSDMFKDNALVKIILFFILFAGVYPALGFSKKKVVFAGDPKSYRDIVDESFTAMKYVTVKDEPGIIVFRPKIKLLRFTRMFEDQITVVVGNDNIEIEGLRKDVIRAAGIIDFKARKRDEQNNENA